MKKRALILAVLLIFCPAAIAGTVTVHLNYIPEFGEPYIFELVASGFADTPTGGIGYLDIAAITCAPYSSGIPYVDSVGTLHPTLTSNLGWSNGTIGTGINLIEGIAGRAAISQYVGNGVLYSFEIYPGYDAYYFAIDLSGLEIRNAFNQIIPVDVVPFLIIPEPGTILLLGLGGLMLRRRRGK